MKKRFYWISSVMYVSMIIFAIFITTITIVLTICGDDAPIGLLLFGWAVSLFCIFSCFYLIHLGIVLDFDRKIIVLRNFKNIKISFNDIDIIEVHTVNGFDDKKYCTVNFRLKNGNAYEYIAYYTLFKSRATEITKKKVELMKQYLGM